MDDSVENILIKPKDIVYGLCEKPPFLTTLFLAIQQIFILFPYLVLVSVIAKESNASVFATTNLISITLLAMGIGTFLQVLNKGPIGSGYLAAACPMPNYLQPSITAVHAGGLGLMAGMVLFSGICQTFIAFFIKRIRFLFPNVLTGLVFAMIGLEMSNVAFQQIAQVNMSIYSVAYLKIIIVFLFTFSLMIIFNIWGRGFVRLLCSALGLICGSILAYFLGLFSPEQLSNLHQTSWISLPHFGGFHYQFSFNLIIIFLISSIASVLRAMGAITTAQEINDKNWQRADQFNLKKGLIADGLTATFAGLIGTTGLGSTPSSVGMSKASGATSRVIAYFVIILCLVLAFCPKIGGLFFVLPNGVIAAGLLFVSCILFIGGIRIMTIQEIDARKMFIICVSLFAGLSTEIFPQFYQQFPSYLHPIVGSLLSTGTIVAFILNLIFRIKIKRYEHLVFNHSDENFKKNLTTKIEELGIKSYIAQNITDSFSQMAEHIIHGRFNDSPVEGKLSYDELDFVITLSYQGTPAIIPTKKYFQTDDLYEENAFIEGVSSVYREFSPDKIDYSNKDGIVTIRLHFAL